MKRQDKYPETHYFHYHNANPKNRITGDCRVRAISVGCDKSYNEVVMDLAKIQCDTGYDQTTNQGIAILLKQYGWIKHRMPVHNDNTKYTLLEFIQEKPKGTYIVSMAHHITLVKDGKCWDIWDCVRYGGKIGNYWSQNYY